MHVAHQELFSKLDDFGGILLIEPYKAILTPDEFRSDFTDLPIFSYSFEYIKNLSGTQFIEQISQDFKNLKKVVVGYDFRFGENRKYSAFDIENIIKKLNLKIEVHIIDEVFLQNTSVHSKFIKNKILEGNISEVNILLGHKYKISGNVVKGQGLGKKELVPTINLETDKFLMPKNGVYLTETEIKNKKYNSLTFVGNRETTDNKYSFETHIVSHNFSEQKIELGEEIKVEFLDFLRKNKKFANLTELKEQIKLDLLTAKIIFNES